MTRTIEHERHLCKILSMVDRHSKSQHPTQQIELKDCFSLDSLLGDIKVGMNLAHIRRYGIKTMIRTMISSTMYHQAMSGSLLSGRG